MLNKMLRASGEKTRLGLNRKAVYFWLAVAIVVGGILVTLAQDSSEPTLDINGNSYKLDVASTQEERIKGLSGRKAMPANKAMLFVFDEADTQCIWMKDMHFALDLVWLNEQKKIVKTEKNVSPGTYPKAFCTDQTKYVIELNAGQVEKSRLIVGKQLTL